MKKVFTFTSSLLFTIGFFAQTFVSTTPENKNVVLEEFTGIHCGYCPNGHVVAQGISDNNPGDVVLVNIHVGSYAAPNTKILKLHKIIQLKTKLIYQKKLVL